jgi:1-aminocyclopropane-1-carboxylate deaminase
LTPNATTSWEICDEYHFGGFAKYHPELIQFINRFQSQYNIQLDPIYTSKMMFAIFDKIEKGKISSSHKILCIHTGGLQGWSGWHHRFPLK